MSHEMYIFLATCLRHVTTLFTAGMLQNFATFVDAALSHAQGKKERNKKKGTSLRDKVLKGQV